MKLILWVIGASLYFSNVHCELKKSQSNYVEPHRIAIIGGGVGGAAAAYFLQELMEGSALIDAYESGHVGGRLATIEINGKFYETGGSIIHPSNAYMEYFVKVLGLEKKLSCPTSAGLYDGTSFVLRDSSWQVVTLARLFWRYGLSIYRLDAANKQMLRFFQRIYEAQARGETFMDGRELLKAMDPSFPALLSQTTREHLQHLGVSSTVINEVVTAVTLANYGQTPDVHAFVGAISVAAASPELWAVKGGNKQIPELLLGKARVSLLRRHVTDVIVTNVSQSLHTFMVNSVETSGGTQDESTEAQDLRVQPYDAVIVAAPLTADTSNINFHNTTSKFSFPGHYQRIIATLVLGRIRKQTFGLSIDDSLDEIFAINPDLFYNAIGLLENVDIEKCSNLDTIVVHKVFSRLPLTEYQINMLFDQVIDTKIVDWRAYPHYNASEHQPALFELQPGLYHLNAIEWLGSAMEMSAIAAKNVALLAFKHLTQNSAAGSPQPKEEL
ncbi:Prenylcysteine lyase [Trinorchestia longiramus]|nr:Prenylcysteine lyase [Trinorchestia longiramus]